MKAGGYFKKFRCQEYWLPKTEQFRREIYYRESKIALTDFSPLVYLILPLQKWSFMKQKQRMPAQDTPSYILYPSKYPRAAAIMQLIVIDIMQSL